VITPVNNSYPVSSDTMQVVPFGDIAEQRLCLMGILLLACVGLLAGIGTESVATPNVGILSWRPATLASCLKVAYRACGEVSFSLSCSEHFLFWQAGVLAS